MSLPNFEVEFTKEGRVFDAAQVEAILDASQSMTDLLVMSHGWNNDMGEARKLYDDLTASILAVAGDVPGIEKRKLAVLRVFWPSKRFADKDLIPGGGAASASQENDDALVSALEELKRDPLRLGGMEIDPVREKILARAQALVPDLEKDPTARRKYVLELRSVLDPSQASLDDGSAEFFTGDPLDFFSSLQEAVQAPGGQVGGGATSFLGLGGAAGLEDLLSGVKAAARRIANFATYQTMKERAGRVGRTGLCQVLMRLRDRNPALKLHLIGHSFGGRLVTAAAHALPADTSAVSLSLLQAAYSHNGLAEEFDDQGHDGAFRALVSEKRASGPIIITHTKNDRAVGIAYPLASRLSRDQAAALGDENDPYGGMGRNGAQRTPEAAGNADKMHEIGRQYQFQQGSIYNLKADDFIADHGDVTGHQVAYAILNATAVL